MFNPLTESDEFRPALAPKKKAKFKKPSDAPDDKLSPMTLDTMLLMDYWCYCVRCIPVPEFAYVRSWLTRSSQDVDLCLRAIDWISRRNPKDFENATHAHRACATAVNKRLEKRDLEVIQERRDTVMQRKDAAEGQDAA